MLSVSVSLFLVGVVTNNVLAQGHDHGHGQPWNSGNHEKFWNQPDFFASLTDYLISSPETQHHAIQRPDGQRYNDHASSASELFHNNAKPPPFHSAPPLSQHQPSGQGQGQPKAPGPSIIPPHEFSAVMNFAIGKSSPSPPPPSENIHQNFRDQDYDLDSYLNHDQRPQSQPQPAPTTSFVRNEVQPSPDIQLIPPPEHDYGQEYFQYYGGGVAHQETTIKPKPRPHPNALSITSIEYSKTSTRKRPQLQHHHQQLSKAHELTTSPATPVSSSTPISTTVPSTSTSRSTLPPRPSPSIPTLATTTKRNDVNKVRYLNHPQKVVQHQRPVPHVQPFVQNIITVTERQPQINRFKIITVPEPRYAPSQSHPPHFRIVTVPQIRQVSPNVEMMAAQVYEGPGTSSFKFKVPPQTQQQTQIISSSRPLATSVRGQGQTQIQPRPEKIRLSPNILIATPASYIQQKTGDSGAMIDAMAQGSNPFSVIEQNENYLQKETPGFVSKVSNILETGRRILYFPKGVVDVVDQAMIYAEANPYVNYVMGSLADTILGSTKGSSAAPVGNVKNKLPVLLIADPAQKVTPKNK